jgi:hypothetical protein
MQQDCTITSPISYSKKPLYCNRHNQKIVTPVFPINLGYRKEYPYNAT